VRTSIYPAATTSAAKVKAMSHVLQSELSKDENAAWLAEVGMQHEDFADERKSLSLATVKRAAKAFATRIAWDPWGKLGRALVHAECIAWIDPLVRKASGIPEALLRLGRDVDDGVSTVVEAMPNAMKLRARQGLTLRVSLAHDPALEEGQWLQHVREAEAIAVAEYFGERADASEQDGVLTITWNATPPTIVRVMTLTLPVALIAMGATFAPRWVLWAGIAQLAVGVLGLVFYLRSRARAASDAQSHRGALLERLLVLREKPAGNQAVGDFSGQMIAGRYRVSRRLGTGGSGAVYEAVRSDDDVHVAVKLLRAGAAHDGGASDRLRREAEALGLAWHPNVVEVLEQGRLPDGTSYMVMEYLDGETLQERLDRSGPLALVEFAPMFESVLGALVAIHAAGIVHRDIKPDNVFLTSAGTKLFDFGIARVEWEEMRLTGQGIPLGTADYMAPEQTRGDEVDARADLYSAAMLACVALSAAKPVEARLLKGVPSALRQVLEHALHEIPDDRPVTAKRWLQDVRAALASSAT
jgi:hypothetical protein